MSVIEKAAKRLEQLRRAGVEPVALPAQNASRGDANNAVEAPVPRENPRNHEAIASISSSGNAKEPTVAPVSFELDLLKLAMDGFVTPGIPRSRLADEFRIIKRPLIANASGKRVTPIKNGNLIMVTSSMPGEGKTFSAVNLAMSIAMELDQTVLLVDADVARPAIPRTLGLPSGKGLLDALQSESFDLDNACIRTNIEKLTILTSGTPHARATELLASDAMDRLLGDITAHYPDRIVIFDSPPLLVTTEARELATHMGQIVFVVQAESTLQADVKKGLAMIESCSIKMIVLNQARTAAQGGYGYGYGY